MKNHQNLTVNINKTPHENAGLVVNPIIPMKNCNAIYYFY